MNAQDINQTFDLLTLSQGDTHLKKSGNWHIGACPFCGGKDRFNLTQKSNGWRWFCRQSGGQSCENGCLRFKFLTMKKTDSHGVHTGQFLLAEFFF